MALLNWYMAAIPLPFGSLGGWSAPAIPKDSDCLQDLSKTENTCTIRKDRDKEKKGIFLGKSPVRELCGASGRAESVSRSARRRGAHGSAERLGPRGDQVQVCQEMLSPAITTWWWS